MLDTQKPKVNEEYISEKFDNEVLLFTPTDRKAIYLNDTGNIVWLLCKENLSIGEIIALLIEQYPDQKDQIRGDVISSLEFLMENNVISITDE